MEDVIPTKSRVTNLSKRSSETPQASETTTLQKVQRLLGRVFSCQHVLYNALHRCQNDLIVGYREHVVHLLVQQGVTVPKKNNVCYLLHNSI